MILLGKRGQGEILSKSHLKISLPISVALGKVRIGSHPPEALPAPHLPSVHKLCQLAEFNKHNLHFLCILEVMVRQNKVIKLIFNLKGIKYFQILLSTLASFNSSLSQSNKCPKVTK